MHKKLHFSRWWRKKEFLEHLPSFQEGMETVLKQTVGVAAVFYLSH